MKVFITGAGGFLGSGIAERCAARGHTVAGTSRSARGPGVHAWKLGEPFDAAWTEGSEVLIHCAYDRAESEARNIQGTEAASVAGEQAGVSRQIFLSSYSARPDAVEPYGRIKQALERFFLERGYTVVRPGLVAGNGGLFARNVRQILRSPVMPLVNGGRDLIPLVDRDDFLAAMTALVECGGRGAYNLFHPELIAMHALVMAVNRAGRHRAVSFPVPAGVALAGLRGLRRIGVRLPVDENNLRALMRNQAPVHQSDLPAFVPRPAAPEEAIARAVAEIVAAEHRGG
jgi:nucleoside-diphosphate-sugar epimerase